MQLEQKNSFISEFWTHRSGTILGELGAIRRISGVVGALGCAFAAGTSMAAQITVFNDIYDYSNPLAIDLAKPVVANNGTVAFLDITDFVTDEKIVAVDQTGVHVLVDPTGTVRPLNVVGPGVSDNGLHFSFRLRQSNTGGFPIDRIYRTTIDGPLVKVAEPGDVAVGGYGPFGAVSCKSNCNVLNDGSVYFNTFNPEALAFGDGGDIETFARADDLSVTFIEDYRASNNGFAAAVFQTGVNNVDPVVRQEFVIGVRETDDPGDPGYNPNQAENANVFLNSDGVYEEFRFPIITDEAGIAVLAIRDTGGQDILTRLAGEALLPKVTTAGNFDSFDRLSFSKKGDLAFLATLDVPGTGEAIYTGPDPIADRLIGPGDVLFGKTVVEVQLAPYDAINDAGQVAFAVRFADNTSKIVKAVPVDPAKFFGYNAQLSTGSGGGSNLSQLLTVPGGLIDLSFDIDRLSGTAPLDVLFGGQLLERFGSDIFGPVTVEIDPFEIFGRDIPLMAELSFRLQGEAGTTLRIGDVEAASIFNGNFSRGYLDGWTVETNDGGTVSAIGLLAPVPLPAGAFLILTALVILAAGTSRPRLSRQGHIGG